jgi:hypothetical protein
MRTYLPVFHRLTSAVLTMALLAGGMSQVAPVLAADVQMTGQLIVSGSVTVNDKRAVSGTTVFNNSKIAVACAKGNSAIVNLGRLGRIQLTPGSRIMLKFADGVISGDLLEGKAVVNTPAGIRVAINTPDGVISSEGREAAVTPVNSQRGVRCVPAVMSSGSSVSALSPGALAAAILGVGGAAAAGAAVASSTSSAAASSLMPVLPPPQN